jgi:hypothetical protein
LKNSGQATLSPNQTFIQRVQLASAMKKLIPVLFLLAFACKKTSNIPSLQITDLPLKGGNSWTYLVTNFPATQTDTAVFQILGPMSVFGNTITYYTTTSIRGSVVDSGTITQSPTVVTYTGDNGIQTFAGSGLFDGWGLNFPITPQSSWGPSDATTKVVSVSANLTLAGNNYANVYTLARTTITPGGPVIDTLLIAPKIGIIKWHGFPLLSYHLQ